MDYQVYLKIELNNFYYKSNTKIIVHGFEQISHYLMDSLTVVRSQLSYVNDTHINNLIRDEIIQMIIEQTNNNMATFKNYYIPNKTRLACYISNRLQISVCVKSIKF